MAAEDYGHWEEPDEYDEEYADGHGFGYFRRPRKVYPPFTLMGSFTGVSTAKAIFWQYLNGTKEWFPRSHIISQGEGQIQISGWLAHTKGLTEQINIPPAPFRSSEEQEAPLPESAEEYGFPGYDPE